MLKFYFLLILAVIGSAKMLGEPFDLSEEIHESSDSQFYSYLADEALRRINFESTDSHHWKLDQILKTSGQIVNGVKYELNFVAIKTECHKQVGSVLDFVLFENSKIGQFNLEVIVGVVVVEEILPTLLFFLGHKLHLRHRHKPMAVVELATTVVDCILYQFELLSILALLQSSFSSASLIL